ncbi:MAG TPA: hypothetical protein VFJ99_02105, partial [Solirubrobacterales bacterium]|nr:hypothetical protein [Solirubrobacterales bacterium]
MKGSQPQQTLLAVAVAVALGAAVGCGGGDSPSQRTTGSQRYFRDFPGQAATNAHLDRADCRELAGALSRRLGMAVARSSEPTPPSSRCRLSAPGVRVSAFLDAGHGARQRYSNRMVEQVQFNAPDPARIPHQVPGVGDRSAGNHYASWIPAYSTLFAVRGNRWLTVAYSVLGMRPAARLA